MAKKRAAKRTSPQRPRKKGATRRGAGTEPQVLLLREYDITYEPMPDPFIEGLPVADQERIADLTERFRASPGDYIDELERLVAEFPQVPSFHNFLSVAYKYARRHADARRVIEETCRKFPDYLFGRTNLALELIFEGRARQVPDVFDGTWDLATLYPERREYHVSEAVSFFSVMALYLYTTGGWDQAQKINADLLQTLDPDNSLVQFVDSLFSENPILQVAARAQIRRRPPRKKKS